MNDRIKKALKYGSVFLLGLFVGAFLLETLEIYLRPSYRDLIIRTDMKTEQEFLSSRAARANRPLDAAFHRWAVVNAESDDGFRILNINYKDYDSSPYLYPLGMLAIKSMTSSTNYERGKKIQEGIDRGKLAVALKQLGRKKEAEEQWQQAKILTHNPTIEATKTFVQALLKQEKSEIYLKAEDKILGPEKK
jgi:hypothetical protein